MPYPKTSVFFAFVFLVSVIGTALFYNRLAARQPTHLRSATNEDYATGRANEVGQKRDPNGDEFGRPADLPLPSTLTVNEYEAQLFSFLAERQYIELDWRKDKSVRDTGPYIDGVYYGTHPAVRVFYSPGIIRWLMSDRAGPIPDGEMIIKEQYPPPAIQHHGKSEEQLRASLESWTVMVKDSSGSHDGWFWSNPGSDAKPFDYHANNQQPYSGFGLYCVRCHASTQSPAAESPESIDNEFTFASLRNIEGFPGEPILFRVDDSWRKETDKEAASAKPDNEEKELSRTPSEEFLRLFAAIETIDVATVPCLPSSSHDALPATRNGIRDFVTSNQCMNCHAGLTGPLGPVGFVHTDDSSKTYGGEGVNVSPYGEWRWTPMGLAGRDPVFYAQVESEIALIRQQFGEGDEAKSLTETLVDTCLRCHGAMGHLQTSHSGGPHGKLTLDDVHAKSETGALIREGVSCMVCHRMQPLPQSDDDDRPYLAHFLETSITGNVHLGPPSEIYGPYQDDKLAGYAMQHAIGFKPKHSDYIKQSQLCGTCHTVSLPTIDNPLVAGEIEREDAQLVKSESVPEFKKFHHHVEQATYLEWLNSQFNNETNPDAPHGQSCQQCHMHDRTFAAETGDEDKQIQTRIAAIQDASYPDAENLAKHDDLRIRVREDYRRHGFAGLNVWLLEYFKQFDDVLGVKNTDYMTGSNRGADQAIAGMVRMAQQQTAALKVDAAATAIDGKQTIEAKVHVTNLAGHRFPTGVGFRRAFIEFVVLENAGSSDERVVWASGLTNKVGVILDENGEPLETEFFDKQDPDQSFQPHHLVINSPRQVQIYETLLKDNANRFTTSFVRGCSTVKDNRLLPKGWSAEGPGHGLSGAYLTATLPGPVASGDEDFIDGTGSDTTLYQIAVPDDVQASRLSVKATLYYQATPPYYLDNLFKTAPDGNATRLLHAIASRVDLENSAISDWKLPIAEATAAITISQ